MPTYQPPRSDADRLAVLKKIPSTDKTDRDAGHPYLDAAFIAEVAAFRDTFRPAYEALAKTLAERMKEVAEREAARARLDTHVRDFWEVLKRRAYRKGQPAAVLAFYGLPAEGTVPDITSFDSLIDCAEKIVAGEGDAVAAGLEAMANPSAAEVAAVLDEARLQAADVPKADRTYDLAQAEIAALRPKADELIDDGISALRYVLRRLDGPGQRRIQRSYGYTFAYLPGEPVDPEPATPPAPTA
jgi:hypothetical protein